MDADNAGQTVAGVNTKFYVLAHYSRHIRPGMEIIDGGEGNTIAAYDNSRSLLVLVTTNYGNPQYVTYDLSNFGACEENIDVWETNTDGGFKYEHFGYGGAVSDQSVTIYFDANSVQTLEIKCV